MTGLAWIVTCICTLFTLGFLQVFLSVFASLFLFFVFVFCFSLFAHDLYCVPIINLFQLLLPEISFSPFSEGSLHGSPLSS